MHLNPILKAAALFLAAALCLSACSADTQSSPRSANIALPEPAQVSPQQILGDASSEGEQEITLHFASDNSVSLTSVTRNIRPDPDETIIERTLDELLGGAPVGGSVEAALTGLETGCGTVTVSLSLEAGVNRSDQDYLLLCSSIANTLLGLDGVSAVNILTGGRSDPLCALPMGAFVQPQENIAAVYAQIRSESDRFPSLSQDSISRNVLLYFPSEDGAFLLPEVRELTFADEDYSSAIINALMEGPLMRSCSFSAIPGNLDLLARAPSTALTASGEKIIELNFSAMLTNYLAFAGVEPWQLYSSLTLSLCSFVPETDAIRICIEDVPVSGCDFNGRNLEFADGLMRRTDFSPAIGSTAALCFANDSGTLTAVEYSMSQAESASAMGLLSAMIQADTALHAGIYSVFPEDITSRDILGVSLEGRTAIVNLSGHFYSRCQNLTPQQERLLVYGMVNTLCTLDHIGAVRFLVEGIQTDSLSRDIYLKTALMPDQGLLQLSISESSIEEENP